MKIKKVSDFEKNILDGNKNMQKFKQILMKVYEEGVESVTYDDTLGYDSITFEDWWNKNGDKLITEFDILELYTKSEVEKLISNAVDDNDGDNTTVKHWIKTHLKIK